MVRLLRSNSCSVTSRNSMPLSSRGAAYLYDGREEEEEEEEEDEEEECEENEEEGYYGDFNSENDEGDEEDSDNPATAPFINLTPGRKNARDGKINNNQPSQFSVLAVVGAALRRSLVTCSVDTDDVVSDVDIGWPTEVRHVLHVTFDRFQGFLGLPAELQADVSRKPPSASASVFGVSVQSMQCSYDNRGNSVPTILLKMQSRLYAEGGLQAEGIFRINPENSQEESVRDQLNRGIVPNAIDVHCLSGLIKAWFRELPSGVLDSLSPDQVMHCNTEEDCTGLVKLLPPTESALLDWAINLMADVVQHEHRNKMNARNIAMVFAPNMTQMADPLTALIHAVQVMNFLKTLIMKIVREREEEEEEEESSAPMLFTECRDHFETIDEESQYSSSPNHTAVHQDHALDDYSYKNDVVERVEGRKSGAECGSMGKNWKTRETMHKRRGLRGHATSLKKEYEDAEGEGILNRLNFLKSMQKLRSHPVFQLSKTVKKSSSGC